MARKAAAITDGKDNIEKLQTLIEKLNGELGAHSAEIDQLKKDTWKVEGALLHRHRHQLRKACFENFAEGGLDPG